MFDYAPLKEFVKEHPDAPAKEAAEKFGCTLQKVYTARHAVGVSKPVTMQKKKRLKVVRKTTLDAKDQRIQELEKELVDWAVDLENEKQRIWETAERGFHGLVASLQEELMQAKAVIVYLEKKVAHGASV
jgi:hypothetical protein